MLDRSGSGGFCLLDDQMLRCHAVDGDGLFVGRGISRFREAGENDEVDELSSR